ncbi:hypothetical protein [Ruegeria sediminis]|nr:hypothetical protein [Ruegeria sediminis]
MGWSIFAHSVRMVFGNLKQVLQITVGPSLVATVLIVGIFLALGIPLEAFDETAEGLPPGVSPGTFFLFLALLLVIIWTVMFWIAVAWHRFILLEEYPTGIFPEFRFDRILAYFGRGLMLGVLALIGFLPLGLLLAAIGEQSVGLSVILTIAYAAFLIICFLRLAIILPSAAVGQHLTLAQAWNSTAGTAGALGVLIIVSVLFQFVVQLVSAALMIVPVLGVLVVLFATTLVLPLINVSILTTMYGVFVEGRELG